MASKIKQLRKVLEYSMNGMDQELGLLQERILLIERFGTNAVGFSSHFNDSPGSKEEKLKQQQKYHDDLVSLKGNVQSFLIKVKDAEIEAEAEVDLAKVFKKFTL